MTKSSRRRRGKGRRPSGQRQRPKDTGVTHQLEDAPRVELELKEIAWGGDAISTLDDGRIVFVDGGFPGQRVEAALLNEKKRFARAVVTKVLDNPLEDAPACPTADRCGGCRFQGVSYEQELAWKTDALRNMLQRLGRDIDWPELSVVPDASSAHYRTRVRLRVDATGATGYLARGSHDFVPAIRCDVLHPALEALREYAGYVAADLPSVHSFRMEWDALRKAVVVEIPCEPDTWTVVRERVLERLDARAVPETTWDDAAVSFSVALRHRGRWEALYGDGMIHRNYDPVIVKQKSGQFAQGNRRLNLQMRQRVADWVTEGWDRSRGIQYVVDLFSGAGNLSFAIAARGTRVVAIDHASDAVDEGEAANPAQGVARVARWVSTDLANPPYVPIEEHLYTADTFVLDPPRGGLEKKLLEELSQQNARSIVYVSCDPAAFARDAAQFAKHGWHVEKLQAWDMFPRTAHLELLAKLTPAG